jgi:hypothetical protein
LEVHPVLFEESELVVEAWLIDDLWVKNSQLVELRGSLLEWVGEFAASEARGRTVLDFDCQHRHSVSQVHEVAPPRPALWAALRAVYAPALGAVPVPVVVALSKH